LHGVPLPSRSLGRKTGAVPLPSLDALTMRIAFMGTPDFAVPTLNALLAAGHEVAAVYTQPPRPAGRGRALLPSPVQTRAEAAEIDGKTAGALAVELAGLGAQLLVQVLDKLPDEVARIPQDSTHATHAPKIEKSEAKLDFTKRPTEVERQVRAFNPVPGAYFEYGGERIKVLAAEIGGLSGAPGTVLDHGLAIACGGGSILPSLVQRAGRGAMTTAELLRGFVIPAGATLA